MARKSIRRNQAFVQWTSQRWILYPPEVHPQGIDVWQGKAKCSALKVQLHRIQCAKGSIECGPNVRLRNTSTLCHRANPECNTYFFDEKMHYPLYNDDGDLQTRTEELPCPAGHWCRDGHRYEIRPVIGREMYEVNPLATPVL